MLDQAILHGKEHRKQYRKSKRFDRSCRNHGSCSYCKSNRTFFDKRKRLAADEAIEEFKMSGWCKYEIYCTECDWNAGLSKSNIPHKCPHCGGKVEEKNED